MLLPVLMFDPVPLNPGGPDPCHFAVFPLVSFIQRQAGQLRLQRQWPLMVPVSDVDVECAKLFGPDIKLEHKSFGDLNITYTLNTESNVYDPNSRPVGYYTPR